MWREQENQTVFSVPVQVTNWIKAEKGRKYEAESKKVAESKEKVNSATQDWETLEKYKLAESNWIEKVRQFKILSPEVCFLGNGQPGKDWLSV